MRSAVPDPDMATSSPAAIAARAIVVPTLPAPTMPRRRSPVSPLNMGSSVLPRRALIGRNRLNRRTLKQLPHARNHLTPVELERRQPLFVVPSSGGVGQSEPTEHDQPNAGRRHG